ncbi:ubiquitin-conjugating enzyme [Gregarina niphandrodes]|uniref:Ubiquitin-conjugating enzyme n=1 Tax=Gregarina niphandrodes TaxID=110365 RepID=A0A023B292_GRENI|nr:ubiquitin-conjugating enzyme [Gregarina niphandrodes]EZG51522.1 ubiquitin-conjugating enzyme [Gregarina niphandrodes]|eukprot:XP_011131960.1 ubiquitin-conjugating enzyme [Gregarina niphandrodes]
MQSHASSIRRIFKEWRDISTRVEGELAAGRELAWSTHPLNSEEPFEWHFTIRGPADSAFEKGLYHGRITLPPNYPLAPPSIYFMTMNGRFDVGKPICLNVTSYHPEEWQPAWGIGSILDAIHAFFTTPGENAAYSLDWTDSTRRQLASQSVYYRCPQCDRSNKELISLGHPRFGTNDASPNISPLRSPTTGHQATSTGHQAGRLPPEGHTPHSNSPADATAASADGASAAGTLAPGTNLDGTPRLREHSPLGADSDAAAADEENTSCYSDYSLLESIPLLWWLFLKFLIRSTDRKMVKRTLLGFLALSLLIYALLPIVTSELWFIQNFPIARPGQDTTLGDNFQLNFAETTEEFPLHRWLVALALHH